MNRHFRTSLTFAAVLGRTTIGQARRIMVVAMVVLAIATCCFIVRHAAATNSGQPSGPGGRTDNVSAAKSVSRPPQAPTSSVPGCVTPPPNMISWFPGDGNAQDILNTTQDLNVSGGVTYPAGKVAQAFEFDGSGSVTYSNINAGNAYTVDFWVRPTLDTGFFQHLISNNANSQNFGTLRYNPNSDQVEYLQNGNLRFSSGGVLPNIYTHIALTYDGSVNRLYLNGNLATTSAVHTETFDNPLSLGFTIVNPNGENGFIGQLDEVEIFNRQLSQTEIRGIYYADSAGKCKPVICQPITLSPASLPGGTVNAPYSQTITASGGNSPYTYSITVGALPSGLMLNQTTGQITGTPTQTGTANFTITATESNNVCTGSQAYSITVDAAPTPTPTPTPTPCVAAGSLDPTFGNGGKVITNIRNFFDVAFAVALQPDGKIIAAGLTGSFDGMTFDPQDFALARYNADGSLDTTFGTGGIVTTDFGTSNASVSAIAVQPDGKIVAAGSGYLSGQTFDFALVRYNPNGSLDTNFGTGGRVTTDFNSTVGDYAQAMVLQPDGKIVVAGGSQDGGARDFVLARYNPDGSLDTSFDTDGKVKTDFGSNNSFAYAIALQPDGRIVVAGDVDPTSADTVRDFALARYNANGSLDTSFGIGGQVTTDFNLNLDSISGIVLQPDGKIVAAGSAFNGSVNDFALARYNPDGSLDTSFDADGRVTTSFGTTNGARAVARQADGKLVAAGTLFNNGNTDADFALARYNADGSLDTSFDTDGKLTTSFSQGLALANALVVQPDGNIVVAGRVDPDDGANDNGDFTLVRYIGNNCVPAPPPVLSINDVSVTEGDSGTTNAVFTVSLSTPAGASGVTFDIATQDGTANAGSDYVGQALTGQTIAQGNNTYTFTVVVNGDTAFEPNETFFVNVTNITGATVGDAQGTGTINNDDAEPTPTPTPTPVPPPAAGSVVISEFRLRGAQGPLDEFVELYNNTDAAITVGTNDGGQGWTLAALPGDGSSTTSVANIPNGTIINARGHLLIANNSTGGYSLAAYAAADRTYTADVPDNSGLALFNTDIAANFTAANRLDAVGFSQLTAANADLFREGAGLAPLGSTNGGYSFVRKLTTGLPRDTNDNAADFVFVAPDGGNYGVQSTLGAPGPENSTSPVQRNAQIKASLIEPQQSATAAPNRVRDATPHNCNGGVAPSNCTLGTLDIRRRFRNLTGQTITQLRFRLVDITAGAAPAGTADLRAISGATLTLATATSLGVTSVLPTIIESPPAQPGGGGLNTSLLVTLPGGGLAQMGTVDLHFLIGVQQSGSFRFLVNVEALPAPPAATFGKGNGSGKRAVVNQP